MAESFLALSTSTLPETGNEEKTGERNLFPTKNAPSFSRSRKSLTLFNVKSNSRHLFAQCGCGNLFLFVCHSITDRGSFGCFKNCHLLPNVESSDMLFSSFRCIAISKLKLAFSFSLSPQWDYHFKAIAQEVKTPPP